ncbi:hypothetical protein vB_AbaM_Acibel004_69 [Acinetobacter phage vB_AbaM_Acibel004]|nr:hypothetical protein vB_AbaM_Acibel004_69 [Acinetobacter phage vB_AbaM_Acibel004]AHY26684.1 hypothetical protein vB_AbaM_Acibel004_69 [Acinetobacter phage vB_AbaM_Acibel004]
MKEVFKWLLLVGSISCVVITLLQMKDSGCNGLDCSEVVHE